MDKFSSLILPSDISNFADHQVLYRYLYSKLLIVIGMPITAIYSIYHLNNSRYLEGGLDAVMFLSLCFFLYDFLKKSKASESSLFREFTIRAFLLFFILSQFYDLWIDQSLSAVPWVLIFPVLLFFSTGIKEALIWILCITGIFFYFLFVMDLHSNPDEIFRLKTKLLFIYVVLTIIAFSIAVIIRATMQKLFDSVKVLETINLRLEKEIYAHNQSEETLKKNEEIFRLVSENANDVIWTIDMDLNYTYISPAIEKI